VTENADYQDLGEIVRAYRPGKRFLIFLPIAAIGPLLLFGLAALVVVDDFRRGVQDQNPGNYFMCLGLLALLIGVLAAVWVSEFRRWRATRTVTLAIYQRGFTWEENGHVTKWRWDEIEKLRYRNVQIRSKAVVRWAKLIKSIVKNDGTTIKLPETLELEPITKSIHALSGRRGPGEITSDE